MREQRVTKTDIETYKNDNAERVDHLAVVYGWYDDETGRVDSNLSAFFLRELESIEAQSYDTKFKLIKYLDHFPTDYSDDEGAETLTYRVFTETGTAKIIADYGDDVPRVDLYGEEVSKKVYSLGNMFTYTDREVRRARMAGKPLEQRRANAARRAVEEACNDIAYTGNATYNIPGFINNANISEYTIPNGVGGNEEWNTKTPDEIIADLSGIATSIIDGTNGVEEPDTMLLPIEQFNYLNNTRMTGGSDINIMQYFLNTNGHIKYVDWVTELKGAGAGGSDRMMVYAKDREKLVFKAPMEYRQLAPERRGYGTEILTEKRIAGVTIYYPQSVAFADNI